ncbi:hypothetical protein R3P38DRAFT_2761282 [Favolaschia claudopus]|uniref:Uncharacterized protein n=1 Tax=Favolaschia claudopus TaxID=2862362 RepID=A0AAW0DXD0_9AGAR
MGQKSRGNRRNSGRRGTKDGMSAGRRRRGGGMLHKIAAMDETSKRGGIGREEAGRRGGRPAGQHGLTKRGRDGAGEGAPGRVGGQPQYLALLTVLGQGWRGSCSEAEDLEDPSGRWGSVVERMRRLRGASESKKRGGGEEGGGQCGGRRVMGVMGSSEFVTSANKFPFRKSARARFVGGGKREGTVGAGAGTGRGKRRVYISERPVVEVELRTSRYIWRGVETSVQELFPRLWERQLVTIRLLDEVED